MASDWQIISGLAASETFLVNLVHNSQTRRSRKFLFSSAQSEQETASSTSLTPTFLLSLRCRAETVALLLFRGRRSLYLHRRLLAVVHFFKKNKTAKSRVSVQMKDIFYWQAVVIYNLKIYRKNSDVQKKQRVKNYDWTSLYTHLNFGWT